VNQKRPKVEPIRQANLFEMEKLEKAAELTSQLKIDRPYSLPGILLGTSAFTANGAPLPVFRSGKELCSTWGQNSALD
jgi:hypothetical protein